MTVCYVVVKKPAAQGSVASGIMDTGAKAQTDHSGQPVQDPKFGFQDVRMQGELKMDLFTISVVLHVQESMKASPISLVQLTSQLS